MDDTQLETILSRHRRDPSELLAILQEIQAKDNYLPRETMTKVASGLGVSLTRVYGMATFFSSFSLKPRGRHTCTVCMGTACHVRGAAKLVEQVEREFDMKAGGTSAGKELTLETVNCVGACALGPLAIVDGEYHGQLTTKKLSKVLKGLKRGS